MSFFGQVLGDILASPITLAAEALNATIKVVEALPSAAEQAFEKIEDAFDRIGN